MDRNICCCQHAHRSDRSPAGFCLLGLRISPIPQHSHAAAAARDASAAPTSWPSSKSVWSANHLRHHPLSYADRCRRFIAQVLQQREQRPAAKACTKALLVPTSTIRTGTGMPQLPAESAGSSRRQFPGGSETPRSVAARARTVRRGVDGRSWPARVSGPCADRISLGRFINVSA
jgi:hypothetical protein